MKFRKDLPEGGNTNFLKLKDKESITGIFRGELHDFSQLWINGSPKEVPPHTPGASFRFRVNFITKEGASYVAKVWEQGITVYRDLSALAEEYDLENTLVKITRNGSTKSDTTYSVMPMPQVVTPETKAVLATIKLNDLASKTPITGYQSEAENPWPTNDEHSEIPF